jgi:hypothetical protein
LVFATKVTAGSGGGSGYGAYGGSVELNGG